MKELIVKIHEHTQGHFIECHVSYGNREIKYISPVKSSLPILKDGELNFDHKIINERLERRFVEESLIKAIRFFNNSR